MLSLKLHMNLMSAARESMWLFLEGGGGLNLRRRDVYWLEQLVHGNLWSVGRAHDDPGSDLRH